MTDAAAPTAAPNSTSRSTSPSTSTSTASAAEQQRVAALQAYEILDLPADDPVRAELDALCELAANAVGAPASVVHLIDEHTQYQVATYGMDAGAPSDRYLSMCHTTLVGGVDVFLSDASQDERFAGSPWVDGTGGSCKLYCSVLLRSPQGHALGSLCIFDQQVHEITDREVRSLRLLAQRVVDVLELRLRTRQLEHANAELLRSQDRLASFAGQISHDLKAPITAILGFTELLGDIDTIVEDPTSVAYLARCTSAARRMLAMIEDMLAYARIGGTLELVPVELGEVVPEVLADLGELAAGADVTWHGPEVVADPPQLRALLQNLIGNALLYRGDAEPRVSVVSEPVGDDTVLRVSDNGPGIPEASREDVLRPLTRLRKDLPGAGLGLALCARVMAAHEGSLRIAGGADGGTVVVARFPGVA